MTRISTRTALATLAALWAAACFAFFQWCYPYHFFYQEQNQLFLCSWDYAASYLDGGAGWLARLMGDFLTQFYYYLYAGATVLTLSLLLVLWLTYAVLRRLSVPRWWAFGAAVVVATLEAVFHLRYDYRLSSTLALAGWIGMILAMLAARRSRHQWLQMAGLFIVMGSLATWLFSHADKRRLTWPDWYLERQFAVDSEYYFGQWDRVVSIVDHELEPSPVELFYYNLVMAQRGLLPDVLLKHVPNNLGTFYQIGPDTPMLIIKSMNELYWALGDMTFTERAAMMACVFSPENRNNRMVRRLAETALVSGDSAAARKFLGLLQQTAVHRRWAQQATQSPRYREKARFNNQQDTIALSDNAHFIMMQLLDSNPQNDVALDYILCSNLLLKDVENFKRDYDRYCAQRPRLKRLYQEALCVWLAAHDAPQQDWQRYIRQPDVLQRFVQYNQQRGNARFRDTYWYYFDKAKAPKP